MGSSDRKNRVNQNHVQISVNNNNVVGRGQPQEHANGTAYVNGVSKRPNFRHGGKNLMVSTNQRSIDNNDGSMMGNMPIPGSSTPPTLLFERLVSEEVQELKSYARIIESQNRRLSELERIHNDLENRLELQTQERMDLEATLEGHERGWTDKCEIITKERDQWKSLVKTEQTKNERLGELILRKDKEIQRMLQRKFDDNNKKPHGHRGDHSQRSSGTGTNHPSQINDRSSSIRPAVSDRYKGSVKNRSPHEYLSCRSNDQSIREREVTEILTDFFSLT